MQVSLMICELIAGGRETPPSHLCVQLAAPARLCIRALQQQVQQRWGVRIVSLDSATVSMQMLEAQLAMKVIGERICVWISRTAEDGSTEAVAPYVLECAGRYRGSHMVVVETGAQAPVGDPWLLVEVAEKPTMKDYRMLRALLGGESMVQTGYEQVVFPQVVDAGWDAVYLMAAYEMCLGSRARQFCEEWIPQIVILKPSLFALAGAFFARDRHMIYRLWGHAKLHYQHEFWVSFWADQVWKACLYVAHMKGPAAQHGHIGRGLPFSFLRRDWRAFSSEDFVPLLDRLARYDERLRSGHEPVWELFFEAMCTR